MLEGNEDNSDPLRDDVTKEQPVGENHEGAHGPEITLHTFIDVLVYNPGWDQHLVHVRQIFEILRQHRFFVKASKCAFGQQGLEYLGHIITSQGMKVDANKIDVMVT